MERLNFRHALVATGPTTPFTPASGAATGLTTLYTPASAVATGLTTLYTPASAVATGLTMLCTPASGVAADLTTLYTPASGVATDLIMLCTPASGAARGLTTLFPPASAVAEGWTSPSPSEYPRRDGDTCDPPGFCPRILRLRSPGRRLVQARQRVSLLLQPRAWCYFKITGFIFNKDALAVCDEKCEMRGHMPPKRSKSPPPAEPAVLSPEDMKAAIPRLRKRIKELEAFDVNSFQARDDPRISALSNKVDQTLSEIFGPNSVEYGRYHVWTLDTAPIIMGRPAPVGEVREGLHRGVRGAIANLQSIIELFTERLELLNETPGARARSNLDSVALHPEIKRAVLALFQDGHYANAVEDACKALDLLVKLRSGINELSGTELMQRVFSAKNPILRFNPLSTETDRSEQQGMMHLYSGAMLALRNPRAHSLLQDHPDRAVEIILFISFLAHSLDRAAKA